MLAASSLMHDALGFTNWQPWQKWILKIGPIQILPLLSKHFRLFAAIFDSNVLPALPGFDSLVDLIIFWSSMNWWQTWVQSLGHIVVVPVSSVRSVMLVDQVGNFLLFCLFVSFLDLASHCFVMVKIDNWRISGFLFPHIVLFISISQNTTRTNNLWILRSVNC